MRELYIFVCHPLTYIKIINKNKTFMLNIIQNEYIRKMEEISIAYFMVRYLLGRPLIVFNLLAWITFVDDRVNLSSQKLSSQLQLEYLCVKGSNESGRKYRKALKSLLSLEVDLTHLVCLELNAFSSNCIALHPRLWRMQCNN